MNVIEIMSEYSAFILPVLAGIIWLVRLEAKVSSNAKDVELLRLQRREDLAAAERSRRDTHDLLNIIQSDVKQLLLRFNGSSL